MDTRNQTTRIVGILSPLPMVREKILRRRSTIIHHSFDPPDGKSKSIYPRKVFC